jgi:hypothetical protein
MKNAGRVIMVFRTFLLSDELFMLKFISAINI